MSTFEFIEKEKLQDSDVNRYTVYNKETRRPIFIKLVGVSVHQSLEKARVSIAVSALDAVKMKKIFSEVHQSFIDTMDETFETLPLSTKTYRSQDGKDLLIFRASKFSSFYHGTSNKLYDRPPTSFEGDVLLKISQVTEGESLGIALSIYEATVTQENRRRLLIDASVDCL